MTKIVNKQIHKKLTCFQKSDHWLLFGRFFLIEEMLF